MNINVCSLVKIIKPSKFIVIGGAIIYPPKNNQLLKEKMINGKDFHPSVKYSAMAKMHLLELVSAMDIDFEYLIVSNAYGPGEHTDPEKSHFIGSLITKIKANQNIKR